MEEMTNIYLIGPMGSGKTTIGGILAKKLGLVFYDSDKEIEYKTGVEISHIFDKEGELGFRLREKNLILELVKLKSIILSTGGGSIISKEVRKSLEQTGIVIFLDTNIEKQLLNTSYNNDRPLLKEKNKREKLEELYRLRKPLYTNIANIHISTNDKEINIIIEEIIMKLKNFRENKRPMD